MAAYAEARSLYPDATQIIVVSVGTGTGRNQITYAAAKHWDFGDGQSKFVPVFMDSVPKRDYELESIAPDTYYRLQVSQFTGPPAIWIMWTPRI